MTAKLLEIDGAVGEGGGQILRTALALAMVTGQGFRLVRIRAGRGRPGLLRQHLTCVEAAAAVCGADVAGATLGSSELTFRPGTIAAGQYSFRVGTAGSTTLVLQTVLPALMRATAPSTITVEGGTHNDAAPPAEFLEHAFLPIARRLGVEATLRLERPGFYPAGGGKVVGQVGPATALETLDLVERGSVRSVRAEILVAHLPHDVAERERATLARALELAPDAISLRMCGDSAGPGNAVLIYLEAEHVTEVFVGFGGRGIAAETVAQRAIDAFRAHSKSGAPVGEHLADQLLLPLALAGKGRFRTSTPTPHTTTNLDVIRRFLDVELRCQQIADELWEISAGR